MRKNAEAKPRRFFEKTRALTSLEHEENVLRVSKFSKKKFKGAKTQVLLKKFALPPENISIQNMKAFLYKTDEIVL